MRPVVCVPCQLFYKPKKNGVSIEEGMPRGTVPETWEPYKLWQGDLLECHGCGAQIVTGFGRLPLAEHYEPDYATKVKLYRPLFRVDDC